MTRTRKWIFDCEGTKKGRDFYLPVAIVQLAGLQGHHSTIKVKPKRGVPTSLTEMNDNDKSFKVIANAIEKNL